MRLLVAIAITGALRAGAALAGPAEVLEAEATCAKSLCRFEVTVRHADEGWDHFSNAWEVLAPDGAVLATRVLRHPHVGEQPFTRALGGVEIPPGVTRVRVRARDSVHGWGDREVWVELAPSS